MKSIPKVLAALLVAGLTLTACSGASGDKNASGEGGAVKLRYAIWDKNQEPAMRQIADKFEKDNPNIKIEIQLTPNKEYWTKTKTAVAGGAAADVMWMNGPNIELFAGEGQLAPMDDAGIDGANYPKGLMDLYTYDGKLYGAPKDYDTIGLWYNKKMFDAAGVDYPNENWTWDDMKAAAAKLTNKEKGVWGIAASQYSQTNYYDTIHQAGGYIISEDKKQSGFGSPEALKGINVWIDMIKAGSSPDAKVMSDTTPEDLFVSQKVAMFYTGSWTAIAYHNDAKLKEIVDVAPMPKGPVSNQSIIHGLANVVYAKSKHVEEAKKFAAFASSKEAAEIMASTGTVIPAYNGTQDAWVKSMPEFNLKAYIDAVPTAAPYPVSKNTSAWNEIETEVMTKIWSMQVTPEEGLKELAEKMQAALDAEQ